MGFNIPAFIFQKCMTGSCQGGKIPHGGAGHKADGSVAARMGRLRRTAQESLEIAVSRGMIRLPSHVDLDRGGEVVEPAFVRGISDPTC